MRAGCSLLFFVLTGACCLAQLEDKKLLERVMGKPDMSLINPMNDKKFQGSEFSAGKKAVGPSKFLYDQKLSAQKYHSVRSFLGVKNPWFGKLVHDSRQASLWSKNSVGAADRKVSVKSAKTQKFYQADERAARRDQPVKTSAYLGRGGAQGSLDQISDKIDKNMTIEQVRELLNKNR
ncbi:MAG TPA: hypothetical protein VFO90_09505 [Terrimicrobiaceae bacterium]|nr:hypothetical protein [Terrimicrobiaceae bacterium]